MSGIDGCVSTAVGYATANEHVENVLVLGDISFFYDVNGLWRNNLPQNLKIVVMNNFRGKIFDIIEGPREYKALEPFIQTRHTRNAEYICKDFGITYQKKNGTDMQLNELQMFLKSDGIALLELLFPA